MALEKNIRIKMGLNQNAVNHFFKFRKVQITLKRNKGSCVDKLEET